MPDVQKAVTQAQLTATAQRVKSELDTIAGTITTVEPEQLWSAFQPETAYTVGMIFRTPTTPSWGYWIVTTAGTSGDATTAPSGTTEGDTAESGTMECVLANISTGGGGGAEFVTKARAWAMSSTSPDEQVDTDSPTGYTQSSKSWAGTSKTAANLSKVWAESANSPDNQMDTDSPTGYTQSSKSWAGTSKTAAQLAKAWADSPTSPDGEEDADSPTGYTQSAKTWEEKAKYYGIAAEQFAVQTEVNVQPSAWSAATTYNYPDVVYYTDGYNYRCVGTNVTGTELPGISQNWVCLARVTNSVWEYDTQGGLMPVINPVGDSDWEIDENGGLMPTAAV